MKLKARKRYPKKREKLTNPLTYSLYIGFFAGVIWGGLKLIEFAMRFTEVVPGFLLEPYFRHAYLVTREGLALGYVSFILFSMVAAVVYTLLLRKQRGPWPGIVYGLLWWALLYLLIGPVTQSLPPIPQLDLNSFVTDMCLFIVWGLFIGYSVAMEFTDERERRTVNARGSA